MHTATQDTLPETFGAGSRYVVESHRLAGGLVYFTRFVELPDGRRIELPVHSSSASDIPRCRSHRRPTKTPVVKRKALAAGRR